MKVTTCWTLLFLAGFGVVHAQDKAPLYTVAGIPDSLKKNAHAVIREESLVFRMEDADRTREINHYVVTVLDPQGDHYGHIANWYQPGMREIRSIKGVLYDPSGQQIRKLKSSDIRDGSDVDDGTMMTDARYKSYNFDYNSYPYTVEYEVEVKNYNSFQFPRWRPQDYDWVAVQHSTFTVQLPDNYPLRYRTEHIGKPKESTPEKGMHQYDWEVSNVAAVHHEILAEAWSRRSPNVITGPGDFVMQQYKGNMNSWDNMGKFFYTLNAGRDVLPEPVLAKVHQLTDTLKDNNAKISALYNYLQQNTRYVSVQLGIGGLQTFDAGYVSKKGYGDCKALSNYMYSLLKAAGIPSCQVLIHGGNYETDFIPDFTSDQFNHVILMVPQGKDTTWLECTSQTLFPGYLGAFTSNRYCLAVNEKGGTLVHTPIYNMDSNKELRRLTVKVDETGNAVMDCFTRSTGEEQDNLHGRNHNVSQERILKILKEQYSLPSYDINSYTWTEWPGKIPAIDEHMQLTVNNYAQITGKRLFLQPNVLNRSGFRLSKDSVRTGNLQLFNAIHDSDTTVFSLPLGYTPESFPKNTDLHSVFGDYHAELQVKDNTLTYIRDYKQRNGIFPASTYLSAVEFFDGIYKADHAKVVFVKQ
ncbi:Transglutaminase-like superfamily protein [Chitinophaga costaii]|uniref:Transglutaminase-like superfamily protein n=1 Tax=Chitinophaga costaii TaxID=1335309 RepID=A0A1C4CC63_9BACT|nr:DUF3857 domain-containing protein [Chitinophaga costaii]PUZ27149.1 DUF3857 domain-containing protein [Chitinophaga costaii]SCC16686.1 Transglutaminase-like superfamily protein [Chitinophaga costaii]